MYAEDARAPSEPVVSSLTAAPPTGEATVPVSPRRRQLLDAAVAVIAEEGPKGLTHRAVDRRAGLPEGSCSAYLRTRRALQTALAEHVADQMLADVDALAEDLRACDQGDVPTQVRDLFQRWLDESDLLVARLELTMAATRDPELAGLLAEQRSRLVEVVQSTLAATGKGQDRTRAETLVSAYDGVLLSALLEPARERPAFLARSLQVLSDTLAEPRTA